MEKPGTADSFDYDPFEDPEGMAYIKYIKDKCLGKPPGELQTIEPYPLVTRAEWGAQPPKNTEMKPMRKPIQIAMFLQTETEECHSREDCIKFLQERQKYDFEHNEFDDIQFNFYISSDGTVYEGRGWDIEADKNWDDTETEDKSVDIAYIGNFNEDNELSKELVLVGCDLIKWAKKVEGLIHENMNITTQWIDHVWHLRTEPRPWNPLDDPKTRDKEYNQVYPTPSM